nr:hypothetical protein [Candidatus Njordarchaeota archaeon]
MFNKEYEDEDTTTGEKFEVLNNTIIQWKEKNVSAVDNLALCRFLYDTFPLSKPSTVPEQVGTLSFTGLLFEPENELGVVSLFSMYHKELGFPFIVKIQNPFPDATVIDDEGNTVTIEFEYLASDFIQHHHPQEECDLIVCWANDLLQDQSVKPEILVLKDEMKNLMKGRFLQE